MKAEEKKLGAAKLEELKQASSATVYKVEMLTDARKNMNALKLRAYGRRWAPSNGEIFEIEPELAAVRGYKLSDQRDGIELYMKSSLSGWAFYPVEWSGMLPDVEDERTALFKDAQNDATTKFGDSIDRARIIAGFKKFKVVFTEGLHGSKWITDDAGKTVRIPDSKDAENRADKTYYKIVLL